MIIHSAHNLTYIDRVYQSCLWALKFAERHDLKRGKAYARLQAECIAFASIG